MRHVTSTIIAALLATPAVGLADDVYIATFTGTFTEVDLDGADPGRFANLDPGDTYAFTIATTTTPRQLSMGDVVYDAISMSLTIDDGVAPFDVVPTDPGFVSIARIPGDTYVLGAVYDILDGPFNSDARLAMLDDDGDPIRDDFDLPLSFDLDAFSGGRLFALTGSFFDGTTLMDPVARATVDTFSARIVPAPGAALALVAPLTLARRRR